MPKPSWRPSRAMAMVALSATLAACAGSPASPRSAEPMTVTTVRTETRLVCPAELGQALPAKPAPRADAEIRPNASASDWLAEIFAWADGVARLFADAQAACPAAGSGR